MVGAETYLYGLRDGLTAPIAVRMPGYQRRDIGTAFTAVADIESLHHFDRDGSRIG